MCFFRSVCYDIPEGCLYAVPYHTLPEKLKRVDPAIPALYLYTYHPSVVPAVQNIGATGVLYAKPAVAVVDTRRPSDDGCEAAKRIGEALARHGFALITGMAEGIDLCVVEGFLYWWRVMGVHKTNVVIGVRPFIVPFKEVLPQEAQRLIDRVSVKGREYPPLVIATEKLTKCGSSTWVKAALGLRNRIIAALADAIIVVEARARSPKDVRRCGSMAMIRYGIEKGKPVLVWEMTSGDPEIELGYKLYKERGHK